MEKSASNKRKVFILAGLAVLAAGMLAVWLDPVWVVYSLNRGWHPVAAKWRLTRAVDRDSDNIAAQGHLLKMEAEAGELNQAKNRLAFLKVKAPDSYEVHSGACKIGVEERKTTLVLKDCEAALQNPDRKAEDLLTAGVAYLVAGIDILRAIELFKEALGKDPGNVKALSNLGYAYLRERDFANAAEYSKKALALDPSLDVARMNLARALYETKQYQSAIAELEKIVRRKPGDEQALLLIAGIYADDLQDYDSAEKYARLCLARCANKDTAAKSLEYIEMERRMREQKIPGPRK